MTASEKLRELIAKWESEGFDSAQYARELRAALAESGAGQAIDREKLAKAIWDGEIAEAHLKKAIPRGVEYAQWPEDSAAQPYCRSTYRMADFIIEALAQPAAAKEKEVPTRDVRTKTVETDSIIYTIADEPLAKARETGAECDAWVKQSGWCDLTASDIELVRAAYAAGRAASGGQPDDCGCIPAIISPTCKRGHVSGAYVLAPKERPAFHVVDDEQLPAAAPELSELILAAITFLDGAQGSVWMGKTEQRNRLKQAIAAARNRLGAGGQ